MKTITLTSDYAQHHWHETIDAACTSQQEVVIEQQGKPVVTLVNYEAFQRMKRELLILQGLKRAEKNRQERLEKPSSTVTLTELTAKLNLADRRETTSTKTLPTSQN
jgi:PHD/YefM family antitoxin component YafN of YafNO toxin-antitoxin module